MSKVSIPRRGLLLISPYMSQATSEADWNVSIPRRGLLLISPARSTLASGVECFLFQSPGGDYC